MPGDTPESAPEHDQALDHFSACREFPDTPEFQAALSRVTTLAEGGSEAAAGTLAEFLALPGRHHDAEAAYRWYYIALFQEGYRVEFCDQIGTPPAYGGPIGDFRNESMVSDLVSELGSVRVQELDTEAAAWLRGHGIEAGGSD